MSHPAVTRDEIARTYAVIMPYLRRTPVIEVAAADFAIGGGANVPIKLELLQHAGSFKARGAFANMLLREVPAAGVVAASGGNHGAAVAFAAHKLGIAAHVFVPSVAAQAKQRRIRELGAELVVVGATYDDALHASRAYAASSGALPIHAFDQPETLLGQGSVGLELEEQAGAFDTLLVAVGGGGLIGGIAAWFAGNVRIVAVEPREAPTLHDALRAGQPVDAAAGGVAADSLAPRRVGEIMFPLAQRFVERVVLVDDAAIVAAQRTLWSVLRVASEPGGATALAALISGAYRPAAGERVALLVCGGNTDAVQFP
jgi:threonine dehydratase